MVRSGEPAVLAVFGVQPLRVGGVERYTRELAAQLESAGARLVAIFSGTPAGSVAEYLRVKNLTLISAPGLDDSSPRAVRIVFDTLRRVRPQVMHFQFMKFLSPLPWMARLSGVRQVLFTAQGSNPPGFVPHRAPLYKRAAVRLINAPLDCVACVSEYTRGAMIALDLLPPNRFYRVYNGIQIPEIQNAGAAGAAFRQRFGIPADRELITQVSWLIPEKGIADLLEAARLVLSARPKTHFALVGSGNSADVFRRQAEQLGISKSVTFTGLVEDPMQDGVYAATDVFCLASRWQEAFGWVLAEAMVFEKPVVATRVGGIPEVVEDGRTGLLAAPGDVAGLADRLIRLLNDPALRLRMGQAGRKTAAEKFDLRRTVAEVLSLYRL